MDVHTPIILILLSAIIIISYLFNLLSRRTGVPSVLLLIIIGIVIKYLSPAYGIDIIDVTGPVKILGAVGLIMIVLEAALDLRVDRSKVKLIRDSFSSAVIIFLLSVITIGFLISWRLNEPLDRSFLYAVPLSIISSAIVIPSTSHLVENKREFIIYESSFSDILGIMAFNFMLLDNVLSLSGIGTLTFNIGLAVLFSVITTMLLMYIIVKVKIGVKFFLLFAVLCLLYGLGELIHLPSLLVVLVFGLVLNNYGFFFRGRLENFIKPRALNNVIATLKAITAETSFLIRTFFFILFGYSVDIIALQDMDTIKLGMMILAVLLLVRYLYIKFILKADVFPLLFLMPRGLVTILLFFSIPAAKSIPNFNEGILFFVVAASSLLMMVGLLLHKEDKYRYFEKNEEVI